MVREDDLDVNSLSRSHCEQDAAGRDVELRYFRGA